jgi:hypothetical protein
MKYRNQPCQIGNEKYRSKREAKRHQDLLLLQKAGQISELQREVPFILAPAVKLDGRTKPALRYFADFVYVKRDDELSIGLRVVEDCKGVRTPTYRIKRHLMRSIHGIEVLET